MSHLTAIERSLWDIFWTFRLTVWTLNLRYCTMWLYSPFPSQRNASYTRIMLLFGLEPPSIYNNFNTPNYPTSPAQRSISMHTIQFMTKYITVVAFGALTSLMANLMTRRTGWRHLIAVPVIIKVASSPSLNTFYDCTSSEIVAL